MACNHTSSWCADSSIIASPSDSARSSEPAFSRTFIRSPRANIATFGEPRRTPSAIRRDAAVPLQLSNSADRKSVGSISRSPGDCRRRSSIRPMAISRMLRCIDWCNVAARTVACQQRRSRSGRPADGLGRIGTIRSLHASTSACSPRTTQVADSTGNTVTMVVVASSVRSPPMIAVQRRSTHTRFSDSVYTASRSASGANRSSYSAIAASAKPLAHRQIDASTRSDASGSFASLASPNSRTVSSMRYLM